MPTVPVVRGPEVSSRGIPAVTNNLQFTPNDFGAGVAQAGQGYVQAVAEAHGRANLAQAQEGEVEYQEFANNRLNNPNDGLYTKQGKDAMPHGIATIASIKAKGEEILGRVPAGPMRDKLALQIRRMDMQYETQVRSYERDQTQKFQYGQFQGTVDLDIDELSKTDSSNPAWVGRFKSMTENIKTFGFAHGWSDEQIQAKLTEAKKAVAKQNVENQLGAGQVAEFLQRNGEPSDAGGVAHVPSSAGPVRGLRNNNPGNIVQSANTWEGQTGSDGQYATFATPEHGIRALGKNLLSYSRQGYQTIDQIINRWAPPSENNTGAYVSAVSKAMGIPANTPVDLTDPSTLTRMATAITQHENGSMPYTQEQVNSGIQAALGISSLPDTGRRVTKSTAFSLLDPSDQGRYVRQAMTMENQQRAEYRAQLSSEVDNAYAAYDDGLMPASSFTQDQFVKAFGPVAWQSKWQDYQEQKKYGAIIAVAKDMSPTARSGLLEQARPTDPNVPNFEAARQRWQKMATKFSQLNTDWEVGQGQQRVALSMQTGYQLDPNNKYNQAGVDRTFTQVTGGNFNINSSDDLNKVSEIATKTGMIPTEIQSVFTATSRSKDPNAVIPAAELFGRLYDSNPAAITNLSSEAQSFLLNVRNLSGAGVDKTEAIKDAYDIAYNQSEPMKQLFKREMGTNDYRKQSLKAAEGFVGDRSELLRRDPSADDANTGAKGFLADYQSVYDINYQKAGGDPAIAKKLTDQQIGGRWAISEVNGNARLMKYAPEALYKGGPKGWQAAQWAEEKKRLTFVQPEPTDPVNPYNVRQVGAITMPTEVKPEKKIDGEVELVVDAFTPRTLDYQVMIRTKEGILQPYYDEQGRVLRYAPDLESWKPYQEMVSESKADTESNMQKARSRRRYSDSRRDISAQYEEAHNQRTDTQSEQLRNYFSWGGNE